MKAKIILTGILMAILAFSMGNSRNDELVSAESSKIDETVNNSVCEYCGVNCQYVDEDGDGVCDNYNNCADSDGSMGQNYVDEDNNGICDNFEAGECLGNGSNGQCLGNGVQYNGNNGHCFVNSEGHFGKGHHGGNSGNRGCHR